VTSSDDPHLTAEEAQMLQKALGIPMKVLHEAGHINAQSGYGAWVKEWVTGN
ncbi:MAG: serine hydrolase family protein, partial [Sulfurospirillum sp.]